LASTPLVPSFSSSSTVFHFHFFPSCLLHAFPTQCTTPLLLPWYTNHRTHTFPM
jgi:hypothetical protein